ncbi:MAG: DUF1573 domain-containing protein [Flavobacteriales bacterium]|nr:DUF1573 domain-containing protein [Flavobacteriales bacterium]
MKYFITLCIFILNSAIAIAQFAEFSFEEKVHKFEPTTEGTPLECTFDFTNTGNVPLIISDYKVECTCTRVEFSKEPILPGKAGQIKVYFDSKGKTGWQYRKILLMSNTKKGSEEIEIRVKILN